MSDVRHAILPRAPHIPDYRRGDDVLRPIWRGRLHALALIAAILPLGWLVYITPASYRLPVAVYAVSLLAVLGVSSAYHILARTPTSQAVMSRIDRAMIYALIAGTYTPIVLIVIPSPWSTVLLTAIWLGAFVGILLRSLGRAPRTSIALYIALGWVAIITAPALWSASPLAMLLIVAGGVFYTVGVGFYASKRPRLSPTHFGYHELFHACTIGGFVCHFAAVTVLVLSLT